MIRILIVVAVAAFAVGGVGAALSSAEDMDPGPTIVLETTPIDDARPAHDNKGAGAAAGGDRAKPSDDRRDDDSFTAVQPQPVKADEPDEPDETDEPDEPDEPEDDESDDD
jgi:hypothetical protein